MSLNHGYNFLKKITGQNLRLNQEESLVESIQSNLVQVLNTRQGMVAHIADFGLPDIHYVYSSLPKSLDSLGLEIKKVLEKYEPRLEKLNVRFVEKANDTFRATYHITGEVREGSKVSKITFQTEVLRDGSADAFVVNQYE
ncbi:MAG: type VI secretion system baseplate subunit TssE [Acidobacteria bacterium]|nr:type VI secretion system baseplate subunit TssE [Acidobacteriota bacterium]